jgi:hypothetical protein
MESFAPISEIVKKSQKKRILGEKRRRSVGNPVKG